MSWLFGFKEEEEQENDYYGNRSHEDGDKQYCRFCERNTEWIYDRCVECENN